MRDIIGAVRRFFRPEPTPPQPPATPRSTFTPEMISELLHDVARTESDDYACSDCDRLLAQFTEAVADGEPASQLMPKVQKHLDMCPHCREEFEALLRVLMASQS